MLLVAGAASNANAQATDRSNPLRAAGSVFTPPSGLASSYRVRLVSEWNRPGVVAPCPLEGGETIDGDLAWTGTQYEGMLRRTTRYRECAVHGRTCVVTVDGSADVHASGAVEPGGEGWEMSLRWSPARDVQVEVGGDCPASYRDGLERLYRTTTQRVVFALPEPGRVIDAALDPSPWAVRVE
jgi:hypothetical protein